MPLLGATSLALSAGLCLLSVLVTTSATGSATQLARASTKAIVKPGARVTFNDTYCTMNFVFRGSDGNKYVGTAGHCPLADVERTVVWRRGKGIPAGDGTGIPIGEFAFAAYSETKSFDFALVRLDRNIDPDSQMAYYGGPTRLNRETTSELEFVNMYGQGMVVGEVSPERQLVAPHGFDDKETLFMTGLVSPGDSGSPATSEADEALGVVVAIGLFIRDPGDAATHPGIVEIARIPYNLSYAERKLGLKLKLLRAPPL